MIGQQRDQNVGVHGADGRGSAVGQIDGAVGEPDVIDDRAQVPRRDDAAQGFLDLVANFRGLFNASAGFGSHVQLELPAIADREEVLSQPGNEQKRYRADRQESRDEYGAVMNAGGDEAEITSASALKSAFERALETGGKIPGGWFSGMMFARLEQIHGEGGDQGSRKDV